MEKKLHNEKGYQTSCAAIRVPEKKQESAKNNIQYFLKGQHNNSYNNGNVANNRFQKKSREN